MGLKAFVFFSVMVFPLLNGNPEHPVSIPFFPTGLDPSIPHIDFVEPNPVQPQQNDPSTIWYDDFSTDLPYLEKSGPIDFKVAYGTHGGSMKAGFRKGEVGGEGNRKLAFGDFPADSGVVKKGRQFDEVFWRIYVRHEPGWQGAPAKMSRATCIVSKDWRQAMILHVWSGEGNSLTLDPASGIKGETDTVMTTCYNDFAHLRWLGGHPGSEFQISSTQESGYWVPVEACVKLNKPGQSDGFCRLWIDGRLEAERNNLNFRGNYTDHGVNAIFLESYWNNGAVKTEERWYDNFVVSTKPIGPVSCPPNPVLYKTPYQGPGVLEAWEAELASDPDGTDVVFCSEPRANKEFMCISTSMGVFTGSLRGKNRLPDGRVYFCRVRQKSSNGLWSAWSRWHQPFRVATVQSAIR